MRNLRKPAGKTQVREKTAAQMIRVYLMVLLMLSLEMSFQKVMMTQRRK
jgi:hypothetical protein